MNLNCNIFNLTLVLEKSTHIQTYNQKYFSKKYLLSFNFKCTAQNEISIGLPEVVSSALFPVALSSILVLTSEFAAQNRLL